MSELLKGIRIIESAMLFNGDSLGMYLGDMGADVIKVESPFLGDYLRDFLGQITPHHSPAHMQVNKNKRSVALDLRKDAGREAFWKLLATADVFIDGNASDACEKLGIGYEAQKAHKPDIVYCQYSGYGSDGPYSRIPTHGQMMNALAAALPMVMSDDGLMRAMVPPPGRMGAMASGGEGTAAGAVHAAMHVAAALVQRGRTGEGCFIDCAGHDGVIANAWIASTYALNLQRVVDLSTMPADSNQEGGSTSAKYQFYETSDGVPMLFCGIEDKFWNNFARAVGREDWLITGGDRKPVDFGIDDLPLRREIQAIVGSRSLGEWTKIAAEQDVPIGPAYRYLTDAKDDPHLKTRNIIVEGNHPHAGPFTYVGEAAKVSGQGYEVRYPAPLLGEHSRELLSEVGVTEAELDEMASAGIIKG